MAKGLILFIHGLGGDAAGTWGSFPELVRADAQISQRYEVASFEYPTTLFAFWKSSPRIQTLADALRTTLDNAYRQHRPVALVTHSLGGLVARQYLMDALMDDGPLRVAKLLLFAAPNTGAGLAKVGSLVSWRNRQMRQLCKDSDLITNLNRAWERLRVSDKVGVRYVIASDDDVVDEASARGFPGNPEIDVVLGQGHRSLVKPDSAEDLVVQILKNFVLEPVSSNPPRRPATPADSRFRVIGFDLDGTLLRGLKFSWTRVWDYLGFPPEVPKAGMRRYLHEQTSYAEWCEWAVGMFRSKGLRRRDFQEIVQGLTVTRNLREALRILKGDGLIVGIISGGIDVILYEAIPDADELFDYIFINKLRFDAEGVVSGVDATDYDFAGKALALEKMCTDHGFALEQAVFVGEGFNDGHASARAGLSIAYPPRDFELEAASHVLIEEDDLLQVIPHVLGG